MYFNQSLPNFSWDDKFVMFVLNAFKVILKIEYLFILTRNRLVDGVYSLSVVLFRFKLKNKNNDSNEKLELIND